MSDRVAAADVAAGGLEQPRRELRPLRAGDGEEPVLGDRRRIEERRRRREDGRLAAVGPPQHQARGSVGVAPGVDPGAGARRDERRVPARARRQPVDLVALQAGAQHLPLGRTQAAGLEAGRHHHAALGVEAVERGDRPAGRRHRAQLAAVRGVQVEPAVALALGAAEEAAVGEEAEVAGEVDPGRQLLDEERRAAAVGGAAEEDGEAGLLAVEVLDRHAPAVRRPVDARQVVVRRAAGGEPRRLAARQVEHPDLHPRVRLARRRVFLPAHLG